MLQSINNEIGSEYKLPHFFSFFSVRTKDETRARFTLRRSSALLPLWKNETATEKS